MVGYVVGMYKIYISDMLNHAFISNFQENEALSIIYTKSRCQVLEISCQKCKKKHNIGSNHI